MGQSPNNSRLKFQLLNLGKEINLNHQANPKRTKKKKFLKR